MTVRAGSIKLPSCIVSMLIALFSVCHKPCLSRDVPTDTKDIDLILSWLPANTQSILVANGPFQLRKWPTDREQWELVSKMTNVESISKHAPPLKQQLKWACSLTEGVEDLGGRKLYDFMQKHTIVRSVWAIFEYVPNPDRGRPARQKDCNITLFQSSESDYRSLIQLVESISSSRYLDSGVTVFECETDSAKENRKARANLVRFNSKFKQLAFHPLLVCAPRPGLLLTSFSGKETLHLILERLGDGKANTRLALPKELPEWQYVNLQADVYGLRHFERAGSCDPSSPRVRCGTVAGTPAAVIDSEAIGFVVNLSNNVLEYQYLSGSKELDRVLKELFPANALYGDIASKKLAVISPGRIQLVMKTPSQEGLTWSTALFWLGDKRQGLPSEQSTREAPKPEK